ncbi:MAG: DUF1858 domain-containing protein [Tissierellia bacterium]|nr:DUF1858 domain-containing protein [Tissierellia bacterium]
MKFTKDMLIGDIIRKDPRTIEVLMYHGMGCVGCPASQMESLEEAAMVHGISLEGLMDALNELED